MRFFLSLIGNDADTVIDLLIDLKKELLEIGKQFFGLLWAARHLVTSLSLVLISIPSTLTVFMNFVLISFSHI